MQKTHRPYPTQAWRMPPLSTIWLCDDGYSLTLGEMIAGYGEGFVTHSFMQRDEALASLKDPKRYEKAEDRFSGYKGMRWAYDELVNETVAEQ